MSYYGLDYKLFQGDGEEKYVGPVHRQESERPHGTVPNYEPWPTGKGRVLRLKINGRRVCLQVDPTFTKLKAWTLGSPQTLQEIALPLHILEFIDGLGR